ATDNDSGVGQTEYRLDGAASWTTYTGPFPITDDGDHTLEFRSIDLNNNVEVIKSWVESSSATTLFAASSAGATNIKVAAVPAGLRVGNTKVGIGTESSTL